MKVHHTKYKPLYEEYILEDITDVDGNELPTKEAKIKRLFEQFNSECGWRVAQVGKQKAIAYWLSGLPLGITYWNDEMVELAVKFGSIDPNPSDKLKEKVCDNYWSFMANIILGMEAKQ